jgi:hypothetical protein
VGESRPRPDGWASATDLAEYAFCPRALYYRYRVDPRQLAPDAREWLASGERWHDRSVGRPALVDRFGPLFLGLILTLGAALAVVVLGLGPSP